MKPYIVLAVGVLYSAVASAAVYECPGVGYTQTPINKSCKVVDLGKPNVYTPAKISVSPAAVSTMPVSMPSNSDSNISKAQQDLEAAKKALEEGKKVRYGSERNYAKYLERIKGLEENVRKAEAALQSSGETAH